MVVRTMKTDAEIQQDVLRELEWDTRVDETDVGVEVDTGIVTLTGTVDTWAKRAAAQGAAHRVTGVLDVANDITVRLPGVLGRTDTDIARAVRLALEWDMFVPDERVRSTVTDGWVTLEGEVDFWTQHEDAESAIRNLGGVRGVTNLIKVKAPRVAVQDVRKAIEDALDRRTAREARSVQIDVHDGRVTVTGTVDSWGERHAVIAAVRGTAGVQDVADRLRVQPYS
jgi:osmotically-inducible protein OsmY